MLNVGNGVQLGSIKEQLPTVSTKELPRLIEVVNGDRSESGWLDTTGHIIGLVRMDMQEREPVIFAFGVIKGELARNFDDFKKTIIVVLLIAAVIALPFGFIVINRIISLPIEQLAFGVQALERGEYVELASSGGRDELGRLARSFNAMSSALKNREERLRKFSMAVEQSPVSVLICSPQGVVEYVNQTFVDVSG
jgi:methyl-accepting chemotaxis protein